MNRTIQALLDQAEENHVMPFFWQHGEDEAVLRDMMRAIRGANCRAVCIESRPHPDFCGPGWWHDMDVILEEARTLGMKVWILDDSHFPTGYANGALKGKPDTLCRQEIFFNTLVLDGGAGKVTVGLREQGLMQAPVKKAQNPTEARWFSRPPARVFEDDQILRLSLKEQGRERDLTDQIVGESITFEKGSGEARLCALVKSRNAGCHRDYINMTEEDSVRLLVDAVYEPHWQHYADEFGKTIAGFFSDEPELGNGFLYEKGNLLGTRQDLPWGATLEREMACALGSSWERELERLWDLSDSPETARVHFLYMDCLTRLVQKHFSEQLGEWCRKHHVMYIGHVIEDDGQHCRTGTSLGHYFRGLSGQDMAGIDDIGGQVMPQGEDEPREDDAHRRRDGTFYHYGLAKLAQSAAALEARKAGRAMCEIFGNYGWQEGVRLEKYLADHFLVRGINYFVPHAFTGKAFPDPDCPPHFYAHGHHPQYRHFGCLVTYMNRAATLISSGRHLVSAGILYHGEAEWCDTCAMPFEQPLRRLYDAQIDCHVIPADILGTAVAGEDGKNGFSISGQNYQVMIVPACSSLCNAAAEGLLRLAEAGVHLLFVEKRPGFVSETGEGLPEPLRRCPVIPLDALAENVLSLGVSAPRIIPPNDRIRILHMDGDTEVVMIVNEGKDPWNGTLQMPGSRKNWFRYDAWDNSVSCADVGDDGISVCIEPLKSWFLVEGECPIEDRHGSEEKKELPVQGWTRSVCEGSVYPDFSEPVQTAIPDGYALACAEPEFSGFVRYDSRFELEKDTLLELVIGDASEGVEVFLNEESAGIQIAPPFRYRLRGRKGENRLRIEVATTLERACYPLLDGYRKLLARVPECASGLTGKVSLYAVEEKKNGE